MLNPHLAFIFIYEEVCIKLLLVVSKYDIWLLWESCSQRSVQLQKIRPICVVINKCLLGIHNKSQS